LRTNRWPVAGSFFSESTIAFEHYPIDLYEFCRQVQGFFMTI
jgi:hypothetical protein